MLDGDSVFASLSQPRLVDTRRLLLTAMVPATREGFALPKTLLFQMPMLMEKTARFLKNHFTRLSEFPPGAFAFFN